jgi:integration host factor subunit beta
MSADIRVELGYASFKEEVMNKSGLITTLSQKENLTEKKAIDIVNLIFKGFTEELRKGGRIEIRGFGSFVVRNYESYTGRNPKTGENIKVSPKKLPFFKVGKELKEKVDRKK